MHKCGAQIVVSMIVPSIPLHMRIITLIMRVVIVMIVRMGVMLAMIITQ